MKLVNLVGRALYVDSTTITARRGKYARACVEIDLSKPLLAKFQLKHRTYRIEYEGLYNICFDYGIYGHNKDACLSKGQEADTNPKNRENMNIQT